MITVPSVNNVFTVTYQADLVTAGPLEIAMYTLSKSSIRVKREASPQLSVVKVYVQPDPPHGVTTITTYYTDLDGVLEIDMHNVVNSILNSGENTCTISIYMYNSDGSQAETHSVGALVDILQGVSYNDIMAPKNKDIAGVFQSLSQTVIVPPNVILNPATLGGVSAPGIIVESNLYMGGNLGQNWGYRVGGTDYGIVPSGTRSNQLNVPAAADTLFLTDGNVGGSKLKHWKLEKVDACTDIVCVRWTSLTGAVRQHYFPIVARTTGADKSVSLLTTGDGYDVDKNTFNGLVCRLSGLTAYGYWYYADLLRASDVHAVVQPTYSIWETEISNPQTAAHVEPLTAETPQGVGFFTFEFTLKMRHYDTF